jgi:hypothetical protein
MRALITGITGRDWSYLAEFLLSQGYEVHGIKRCSSLFNTDRIDHRYHDPHPNAKTTAFEDLNRLDCSLVATRHGGEQSVKMYWREWLIATRGIGGITRRLWATDDEAPATHREANLSARADPALGERAVSLPPAHPALPADCKCGRPAT